ncbi:MAG TPA: flagellar basal body P-ring formation chaperone FlgA [Candidatus Hydrogenedentes bacterium]|nr:flagellar basal body P-ring formation chaperone FlgA [Candidatus Hydrogenedentota bacterium]
MHKTGVFLIATVALMHFAGADTLTLKEEAFIKGPKVFLGDIADIEGENADALASIDLGSAPQPGESRQLHAALVESRLRTAGVKNVVVKGAPQVRTTTLHTEVTPDMIVESLRMYIESQMPWEPENTEINVPIPQESAVVPDGELSLIWRASPQYRYLGEGSFQGSIEVDGHVQKTLLCRAIIETYANVVLASTDIQRGKPISRSNVESKRMAVSRAPAGVATRMEEVVGLIASKTIFPGQPITNRNVVARTVVHRNQIVPVEMRSGVLFIQTRACALNDARAGELVVCANLNSSEQFQGVVREDGVVVAQ